MGNWSISNPCKNCNKNSGTMIKCTNCGTLGCTSCIGAPVKSQCKVCKKFVDKVKV